MLMLIFLFELLFYPHFVICESRPLKYAVDEEARKDTYIGNIIADTGITTNQNLQLHFADRKTEQYLRLESPSGSLYTKTPIDREKLCPISGRICHIEAAVQIALGNWINIFIEIKDINDHAPKFAQDQYQYFISENTEPGYLIRIEYAQDLDSGLNSVLNYDLETPSPLFSLIRNKEDGLYLKMEHEMDYEKLEMRKTFLKLVSCDSGKPKLCGYTTLLMTLNDVNDNTPKFSKSYYETFIQETVNVNYVVITLSATDEDSGENGRIKYSIADSKNSVPRNYFKINSNGQLFIGERLDKLEMEDVELKVLAEDSGSPVLRSSCIVKIKIVDINNHKPEIKITPNINLQVPENKPANFQIGLVSVVDRDKGNNGQTQCHLYGATSTIGMKLENRMNNKDFYIIVTLRVIDREVDSHFNISVVCIDKGSPELTSYSNVTVLVLDENEFYPTWINTNMSVSIREDIEISKNIIQLVAKDKDATANLTYHFLEESVIQFHLNPFTGWLSTKTLLDREANDIYKLSCYVVDKSDSKRFTSMTVVIITIMDVNDNFPILGFPKKFEILENLPASPIGLLMGSDKDVGNNSKIKYEIVKVSVEEGIKPSEEVSPDIFRVDPDKGQIFSTTILDREEVSIYSVMIRLTDNGDKPLKTEENVEIIVLDDNDNRPVWNLQSQTYNFTLPFDLSSPLIQLKATDRDSNKNANITYNLLSRSESFRLYSIAGHLYPSKLIKEGEYKLPFQACDNGYPPSYSEVVVIKIIVWPQHSEDKEKIESLLIIIISSATCIVFLCLLSAIAIVRWQRDPHDLNRIIKENDDHIDNNAINKWTDHQNQYALSIANQYYRPVSITSQDQSQNCEKCNGEIMACDNTTCSMFHFRYPLIQELEMSSADSGKGTIDEDNLISDFKIKTFNPNRNFIPMNSPYQTPVLSKFSSNFFNGNSLSNSDLLRMNDSKEITETNIDSDLHSNAFYHGISSQQIPLNSFLSL